MEDKKEETANEIKNIQDFQCPICYLLIAEPIKLDCPHLICLCCVEKLLISLSKKCPICRTAFEESKLNFDNQFFRKNYTLNQDPILDRFETIYTERLSKKGNLELSLAYGNEHIYHDTTDYNKHKWKAFVRLQKSNNVLKSFLGKFKSNAYAMLYFESQSVSGNEKLAKILELMQQKGEVETEFSNINVDELDIIKRVIFHLHPTFNPPVIYKEAKPFEIHRLGWGTFTIQAIVEFKDNLKLENVNLDIDLCFTRPLTQKHHPIWIPATLE